MTTLERVKPDPIPAIRPVPEYLAEGDLAALYEDTKRVMQVPWMGVVAMAFAHYRTFYATLWSGLSPMFESGVFVDACAALRKEVEQSVAMLSPPLMTDRLRAIEYAPREIDNIRDLIETFSHGNFPYCMLATFARLALERDFVPPKSQTAPIVGRHAPDRSVPFVLMEAHHADAPTRALYDDIKASLGLPFVNTDYRGLARWPSYFSRAWDDLKPHIAAPGYERMVSHLHDRFVKSAAAMPNPAGLTPEQVRDAATSDAPLEDVIEVCRLFQWLLPGLIVNVAYFRHQLIES